MNATMVVLTIGSIPASDVIWQLIPDLRCDKVTCISLFSNKSRSQVLGQYAPEANEKQIYILLDDGEFVALSHTKVECDLQANIEVLEHQGVEVIWLASQASFTRLSVHRAVLLDPQRLVPPLIASIVDGHQAGILLPYRELHDMQAGKWETLATPPIYGVWNGLSESHPALLTAGQRLLDKGARVLVLDCPGYRPADRDVLENNLDVPVVLSGGLMAEMAQALLQ